MRHLGNTLFVTTKDSYLSLDSENVVVSREKKELGRFPLHALEGIVSFSYAGASPALMGACAKRNVTIAFCTPNGRFLARAVGETSGNVLLRRNQYRVADDPIESCRIARGMIFGKLYNSRWGIERTIRDHRDRVDVIKLQNACQTIKGMLSPVLESTELDTLRGLEGAGATAYFDTFDDRILRNKDVFFFRDRNRRPPLDCTNALLSFAYALLGNDCAAALESVGLDSYVGFLHRDRPGRNSLALDLMEELRPCVADRFVLTLINTQMISESDFDRMENGSVFLNAEGKKIFLKAWQERKQETITHPYLEEKIPWGLVPYVQSLLLSRYLREDLEEYPPFLWK